MAGKEIVLFFERHSDCPIVYPERTAFNLIKIFNLLLEEQSASNPGRLDTMSDYVRILIRERSRYFPIEQSVNSSSAARISQQFFDLLEQQFPILDPAHTITIRNASEFAKTLGIHPNHLNKAVKSVTGETISQHLSRYLLKEAKSLLLYTDWPIAGIAQVLGYHHASNFNTFFKMQAGITPKIFRHQEVGNS